MPSQTLTSGGRTIPAAYQKWNLRPGFHPPEPHRLRFFMLGMPGKGKTTYAASMDNTIFIDPEDTVGFCEQMKATPFIPKNGTELQEFIDFLISEGRAGRHAFKHVVFDTAEKVLQFIVPHISEVYSKKYNRKIDDIREFGEKGAGWGKVNGWFQDTLNDLYMAGYGWTCIGHQKEEVRNVRGEGGRMEEQIVYRSALNAGILSAVSRDAQFIGNIHRRTTPETRKKSVKLPNGKEIETTETVSVTKYLLEMAVPENTDQPATALLKQRLEAYMPERIDITGYDGWDNFVAAYNAAIAQVTQENQNG